MKINHTTIHLQARLPERINRYLHEYKSLLFSFIKEYKKWEKSNGRVLIKNHSYFQFLYSKKHKLCSDTFLACSECFDELL